MQAKILTIEPNYSQTKMDNMNLTKSIDENAESKTLFENMRSNREKKVKRGCHLHSLYDK